MTEPVRKLTNERYWSSSWQKTAPGRIRLWQNDPPKREMARLFAGLVSELRQDRNRIRILEIGCANSFWLPYFKRSFDVVDVYGLDYSAIGCRQAQYQLARQQMEGHVWCQDFFTFTEANQSQFDLIISFGFVEHFSDPGVPLRAMHSLLASGGYMFASVPNMPGIYGWLQKLVNRSVYDVHFLLDAQALYGYTTVAGFDNIRAGYIGGPFWFGVINVRTGQTGWRYLLLNNVRRLFRLFDMALGSILDMLKLDLNQRFSSPFVYVIGRK